LDAKPYARLLLGEERLALLLPDQPIRFFFDAFPYQRYGTITGRLDWISPAAVETEDGQQFIGLGSLDEDGLSVGGERRSLRVGMTGEARIMVGNRSVAEMVFGPLRQLRERLRR
jgi:HlyD family secretion protein